MSEKSYTKQNMPTVNFGGRRRGPGSMGQEVEKPKDARHTLIRLTHYLGAEKLLLLILLCSVILVTLTALAAPALQGEGIDLILAREWERLASLLIALLAVYLVSTLCTLAQTYVSAHLSQRVVRRMRHDLFRKIDRLSIPYLDTHSNGDIMSRMTNDVENISTSISQSLGSLFSGVLTIVGTVALMFRYCWQLTLITMVTVIITVFVTRKMSALMRKVYRKRSQVMGQLNGHSEEMITGYKSIVAFNKQTDVIDEFNRTSDELAKISIRAEILGGSMGPLMNCISNVGFVIVSAFGGYFALKGLITVGTISAFIIYAKQFSRPINEIAQLYGSLQTAVAGAERIFELLDNPDEDNSGSLIPENVKGEITFRNVHFSYIPGNPVLQDFDLTVKPGQKIALVGATGSGKTTVVNLLMRFYAADSGEILIDGVNIRDISRDALRHNIAIVLQDTVLFTDTVENNIKYADPDAPEKSVIRAAEMSNAARFIRHLPKQYQTLLVRAGAHLSQGQRQLLTIARAVLADPKILILDEATSSVDTRTEKNIQDAMVKLMKNRTSLIIAHRLSTIQDADKIVVMHRGRVVEMGNHEELLAKKGSYYDLYMTQFAGGQI
ncbi:MAG: ABC transporter ATP-binding protein/permease [Clostridium sp.]|nr:ABC transporter ATP-binding protein/permease [Acetatifactor muris]MCM1526825.1 ABC transporter ATP-binding protein/permease [Bacteroides sp.]MCM1562974.1 ABC transporter ATP-binding protein/permease [Clostridium sp.]